MSPQAAVSTTNGQPWLRDLKSILAVVAALLASGGAGSGWFMASSHAEKAEFSDDYRSALAISEQRAVTLEHQMDEQRKICKRLLDRVLGNHVTD